MTQPYASDDDPTDLEIGPPCGYCGKPVTGAHSQMDGKSYHLHCIGRVDRHGEAVEFEEMDPVLSQQHSCSSCGAPIGPPLCKSCEVAMGS